MWARLCSSGRAAVASLPAMSPPVEGAGFWIAMAATSSRSVVNRSSQPSALTPSGGTHSPDPHRSAEKQRPPRVGPERQPLRASGLGRQPQLRRIADHGARCLAALTGNGREAIHINGAGDRVRVQTLSRPSPQAIRPMSFQDLERCRLAHSVGEQCKRARSGDADRWRTSRPGLI